MLDTWRLPVSCDRSHIPGALMKIEKNVTLHLLEFNCLYVLTWFTLPNSSCHLLETNWTFCLLEQNISEEKFLENLRWVSIFYYLDSEVDVFLVSPESRWLMIVFNLCLFSETFHSFCCLWRSIISFFSLKCLIFILNISLVWFASNSASSWNKIICSFKSRK